LVTVDGYNYCFSYIQYNSYAMAIILFCFMFVQCLIVKGIE